MDHNPNDVRWYLRTPRSLFGGWTVAAAFVDRWHNVSKAIISNSPEDVCKEIVALTSDWPFIDHELNIVIEEFIVASDTPFCLHFRNGRVLTAACAHEVVFRLNDEVLNPIWQRCGLCSSSQVGALLLPGTTLDKDGHWHFCRSVTEDALQQAFEQMSGFLKAQMQAVTDIFREAYLISEAGRDLMGAQLRRELAKAADRRRISGHSLPSDAISNDVLAVRDHFSSQRVKPRLNVSAVPPEAILDGVVYAIEPDDAKLLIACIEAQGAPVSAERLEVRTNRVRNSLVERNAGALANLLESSSGKGTFIARSKLAELGLLLPAELGRVPPKVDQ